MGIGAAAGGFVALEALFAVLTPAISERMAFVLVHHGAPEYDRMLIKFLDRFPGLEIHEAVDGMAVRPGVVYAVPPGRDMGIDRGRLYTITSALPNGPRLPIDLFFRSLARDQGGRAVAIVLSGSGTDGTLGVRAIKGEGGMVMAQRPDTTVVPSMSGSAISSGLVDYVLPPAEMPALLAGYVDLALARQARSVPLQVTTEASLDKICAVIWARTGRDFSRYKRTSLARRIARRMALHQLGSADAYQRFLEETPQEVDALFQDLLVGVTSFFRDPEMFATLGSEIIPRICEHKKPGSAIRVWVCGCSTGEEAYSVAMVFQEHMENLTHPMKLQIFATDIDSRAINAARAGEFPASIAADVSPERLERFFVHEAELDIYRVHRALRDQIVFSEQDVLDDPPFSRLDLITCRNLMIYLGPDAQKVLISLFHYALEPHGILILGTSETVGSPSTLFNCLDRTQKIYERQDQMTSVNRLPVGLRIHDRVTRGGSPRRLAATREPRLTSLGAIMRSALLSHYGPSAILVNARGDILYVHGRTGNYLEPAEGVTDINVLAMARDGLRRAVSMALRKAIAQRAPIRHSGLAIKNGESTLIVDLTVRPLVSANQGDKPPDTFLIVFDEAPAVEAHEPDAASAESDAIDRESARQIAQLKQELNDKEEYLQSTLEEIDVSNEELRSTNEEMQSINEELQSTNEELETSKEELQSVNEELATVNAALHAKIAALSRMNNDMNNLLAGTGVGTIFVDHELNIVRFTPAIVEVLNVIRTDIGRPMGHIVSNLVEYNTLVDDVREVLRTRVPRESIVWTRAGSTFLMSIRPYRILEQVIDGAVLTFVDVTSLIEPSPW